MSFIETVLDGKTEKERKNKAVCAVAIVITAILLIIAIIAFTICQLVGVIGGDTQKNYKVGKTEKITLDQKAVYSGNMLLLDDEHPYKGEVAGEIIYNPDKAFLSVRNQNKNHFQATTETLNNLYAMVNACNTALNDNNLVVTKAYDKDGSNEAVFSAGTAIAFNYYIIPEELKESSIADGKNKYAWLYENAHKYGFIALSQDSNVFRYVGVDFATAMKTNNLSFEEFTAKLKKATPENPVFLNASKTKAAYYCKLTNVLVPVKYSYTTCGDNQEGIFVTVNFEANKK